MALCGDTQPYNLFPGDTLTMTCTLHAGHGGDDHFDRRSGHSWPRTPRED